MLKNPIRWGVMNNISRFFLTCCVIHNMVFEVEGTAEWMIGEDDLEVYDPLAAKVREEALKNTKHKNGVAEVRSRNRGLFGIRKEDPNLLALDSRRPEHEQFEERRNKLITHYDYLKRNRLIDNDL